MSQPKDIVLLIDGTLQGPERPATFPTNVEGLAYFLEANPLRKSKKAPRALPGKETLKAVNSGYVAGYLSGVGADSQVMNVLPAATGAGTALTIRRAYRFLISHYEPNDHIYLFGFSRGAFAVRSLAGFVHCIGTGLRAVPTDRLDRAIDEAYQVYELFEGDTEMLRSGLKEYLQEYLVGSRRVQGEAEFTFESLPIYFIGIWDAVAALGLPKKIAELTRVFNSYHQTTLPPNVTHAFHALSLHELRSDFEPHVWSNKDREEQNLEQRWFAGDHSDVGGGHSIRELSEISLAWMLEKAASAGFTALSALGKSIKLDRVNSTIRQVWQDRPFCIQNPQVRELLKRYGDLKAATVLCSSFDPTVEERLASANDPDYSGFRIGFGKTFGGIRSDRIQIDALKEVDQCSVRGLLRTSDQFKWLSAARQESVLGSTKSGNCQAAKSLLSKEAGEQAAEEVRAGTSRPVVTKGTYGPNRKDG